jgi:hypothetical protein
LSNVDRHRTFDPHLAAQVHRPLVDHRLQTVLCPVDPDLDPCVHVTSLLVTGQQTFLYHLRKRLQRGTRMSRDDRDKITPESIAEPMRRESLGTMNDQFRQIAELIHRLVLRTRHHRKTDQDSQPDHSPGGDGAHLASFRQANCIPRGSVC